MARQYRGPIDLGSSLINNVADPVSAQDAMTRHYADATYATITNLALKAPLASPSFTGTGAFTGTGTGLGFGTGVVASGVMTGGKVDAATHIHLLQSYTQTVAPTDRAIGTAVLAQMTMTGNDNSASFGGPTFQTGVWGPAGVFQIEGTAYVGTDQGIFSFTPIGMQSTMVSKNVVGANRVITPGWDFISSRIYVADTNTVTLHGNDIAKGTSAFVDSAAFMTVSGGTMNGTTNGYEITSFLSTPSVSGNTHVTRRVGYDLTDLNMYGAARTDFSTLVTPVTGADAGIGTVDQQIGVRIQALVGATDNIGIENASSYVGWDGTAAHGAVIMKAGNFGSVSNSSIGCFGSRTDSLPIVEINHVSGAGYLQFGPANGAADVTLTRTGTGAASFTAGTITIPTLRNRNTRVASRGLFN